MAVLGAGLRGQATGPGYKAGQHGRATYRAVLQGRVTGSGYEVRLRGQATGWATRLDNMAGLRTGPC